MKIKEDVLGVLSALVVSADGREVRITETLDRKLYADTNKVLEALGGKWTRAKKAHVFPVDVTERLEATMLAGEIRTAADLGFFATPTAVGSSLIRFVGGIDRTHQVLEPSAGEGDLVAAILLAGGVRGERVTAVEMDAGRFATLRSRFQKVGVHTRFEDFLRCTQAMLCPSGLDGFDRVIANPPFGRKVRAATGGDWMDHVRHAFTFLRSGGVLGSIVPGGIRFRRDKAHEAFVTWVEQNEGEIEDLPEGSFSSSGTDVRTCMIRMVKP